MLATHRMALHQIPELGFHEFKTKEYLYEQIKNCGGVILISNKTQRLLFGQISTRCPSLKPQGYLLRLHTQDSCTPADMMVIWQCS